jgi:hypothetical protein
VFMVCLRPFVQRFRKTYLCIHSVPASKIALYPLCSIFTIITYVQRKTVLSGNNPTRLLQLYFMVIKRTGVHESRASGRSGN